MCSFTALEELASILDTADEEHIVAGEPTYSQLRMQHACGSPACALGHWHAVHPEHNEFLFAEEQVFEISADDWYELFDYRGCGGAQTSKEAAAYIRGFIARQRNEESISESA